MAQPETPVGVPDSWDEHIKLMADLQVLAFQADITRVSSLMMARDVSSRVYPDRVGEVYHCGFNPQHRWYYFPHMQRNEAVVFKTFDSSKDGRARWTAHTAFDDPTSPPDAPPRESIEMRTLAFF